MNDILVNVNGFKPAKVQMAFGKDRDGIGYVKANFYDDFDNHVGITLSNEQAIRLARRLKSMSDYNEGLRKL